MEKLKSKATGAADLSVNISHCLAARSGLPLIPLATPHSAPTSFMI